MEYGKRIKDARNKSGLTQKQLGERLGVSESAVAQYESGQRVPKVDTLQRIADALNIPSNLLGIATLIDGAYTQEEMKAALQAPTKPTAQQIGAAYEKATPPPKGYYTNTPIISKAVLPSRCGCNTNKE